MMATSTRQRDSMGRFLPAGQTKRSTKRAPRARDSQGRFLPKGSAPKSSAPAKKPAKRRSRSRKTSTPTPAQTQVGVTHIALVLDNSASMRQHQDRAAQAFNEICETIKEQGQQQDIRVSFYTFGHGVKREFFNQSVDRLNNQDYKYNPYEGTTALYQAIRDVSNDFARLPDSDDPNVSFLVQIITDGQENKRNVSQTTIQNMIRDNQNTDRWTYAISCPQHDVGIIERTLGIFGGNVDGWNTRDRTSMTQVGQRHSQGVSRYMTARATGQGSVKNFFTEINVGRQSVSSVKRKLVAEAADRFRLLTVDKARKIKEFIESKNLVFEKGRVFYQLNKPEIVQSYKEIILQDKNNPSVFYGGPQVRQILGIPEGREGKVSPGNLGEWNVWIQSTSVNRNLLAKMKVLFDQRAQIAKVPYRKY